MGESRITKESLERVHVSECPGGPDSGCCEFCTADCETYSLDGVQLSTEEFERYYLMSSGLSV